PLPVDIALSVARRQGNGIGGLAKGGERRRFRAVAGGCRRLRAVPSIGRGGVLGLPILARVAGCRRLGLAAWPGVQLAGAVLDLGLPPVRTRAGPAWGRRRRGGVLGTAVPAADRFGRLPALAGGGVVGGIVGGLRAIGGTVTRVIIGSGQRRDGGVGRQGAVVGLIQRQIDRHWVVLDRGDVDGHRGRGQLIVEAGDRVVEIDGAVEVLIGGEQQIAVIAELDKAVLDPQRRADR